MTLQFLFACRQPYHYNIPILTSHFNDLAAPPIYKVAQTRWLSGKDRKKRFRDLHWKPERVLHSSKLLHHYVKVRQTKSLSWRWSRNRRRSPVKSSPKCCISLMRLKDRSMPQISPSLPPSPTHPSSSSTNTEQFTPSIIITLPSGVLCILTQCSEIAGK